MTIRNDVQSVYCQTPATELGSRYALLPKQALEELPPGELMLVALAASLRRRSCWLDIELRDAIHSVGYCGRTFHIHWQSLAAKGWLRSDRFAATGKAIVKPGARFAKVRTDLLAVTPAAAFKLYCWMRLYTDKDGNLHVSRKWLARKIGQTRRSVRRKIAQLKPLGYRVAKRIFVYAEKAVRSRRKIVSFLSRNGSKKVSLTRPSDLNNLRTRTTAEQSEAFEAARRARKREFARYLAMQS